MIVNFQNVIAQCKNPVADIYLTDGKIYRECHLMRDDNPNPIMMGFVHSIDGTIVFVPIAQISRIEMYDLPEE